MSDQRRKVLFVDHAPIIGGAQLVLLEHIALLDREAFEPVVACTGDVPDLVRRFRDAGATVHIVPMGRLRSGAAPFHLCLAASRLRSLIRREGIDLVVTNTSRAAYTASLATIGTGIPLVWSVRDFLFGRRVFRLFRPIPKRIVGVSEAIRDSYGPDLDGKFSVINVGSSLLDSIARVSDEMVVAERARWCFDPRDVVVGFMGRLVSDKGVEDVVTAARLVHEKHPHVKFLIAGTGKNQEGDVEAELRSIVRRDRLDYVVLAGHQTNETLYYRLFDIFVLASRAGEAYATSVVQAMMARRPVIATATGGTPELVVDRQTGLLIEPRRPDQLAAAIGTLIEDPTLADRIAARGYDTVAANNRADKITRQYEALYQSVLQGDRAAV
jgi:glycosyltransferase involved in cell wall biosynthesis